MNTQIYLWVEPMRMNHKQCSEKVYFNYITKGDYTGLNNDELEAFLSGSRMASIMDFADIDCNLDYKVVSVKLTSKDPYIEFTESPEERQEKIEIEKTKKAIKKIVKNKKPIQLTDKNVDIKEGGIIEVSVPSLKINDKIDFAKIWDSLEKNFIGKIKEGDTVVLYDDNNNKIFEMIGGSFLNIGLADLKVYDAKKKNPIQSIFTDHEGLKGGAMLREDGTIDVGDYDRTFYLKIYTGNLLKASLKLDKSLMEITQQKLLK